jgi:hypothetical protein
MWRRHLTAPVFFGFVALLVVALLVGVVGIRTQAPDVPAVDTAVEARRARERQLRLEGVTLLQQGRVPEARAKFEELQRLAPKSQYVRNMMDKLNAMRQQDELGRLQLAQAQAKYTEGMTLFTEKKYPDAILRFQEALAINPTYAEAAAQLALAQAEQQKIDAARLARQQQRQKNLPSTTTTAASATETAAATQTMQAVTAPAQIATVFVHPFTDGNMIVRIGGDVVVNEPLYTERRRRVFNTLVRQPRNISTSREFPAKNADVQVWITVPAMKISEHHNIGGVRFEPGSTHRLVVRYNATTKVFTYSLD